MKGNMMSEQTQVPLPRAALQQWQSTKRSYNVDEYVELITPTYRAYEEYIRRTVSGLTTYAAQCAAAGQGHLIPMLRGHVSSLVSFWLLDEEPDIAGNIRSQQQHEAGFDQAVNAARRSGVPPEMTEESKQEVLTGLELYAQEMETSGDMDEYVTPCRTLLDRLAAEWRLAPAQTIPMENIARQEQETSQAMM